MYLCYDGVEVNAEVQSSTVNDVQEVSQGVGYAHEVVRFHGRPQLASFFLDEFASADSTGHRNDWPAAHGGADILVELANQPGRRTRSDDLVWIHANMLARHRAWSPVPAFG